jgi:hypothetical protein
LPEFFLHLRQFQYSVAAETGALPSQPFPNSHFHFIFSEELALPLHINLSPEWRYNLTFVCPCIVRIIVNDDRQNATILANLFIPNQLYMFRAKS